MSASNLPEPVREALRRVRRDVEGGPEVNLVSLAIVENHIAALTQQAEERARDAARYRKIRSMSWGLRTSDFGPLATLHEEELDAALDAMKD